MEMFAGVVTQSAEKGKHDFPAKVTVLIRMCATRLLLGRACMHS